jgi:hypothetical protein
MNKNSFFCRTGNRNKFVQFLFTGSERDGKFLEPVLKPYLIKLYIASHECNWFLEEWKARMNKDEMYALRKYCHLVVKEQVNTSDGLLDCVNKGEAFGTV